MKQEDKQLLSADLCARLPYGVMIQIPELFYPQRKVVEKLVTINDLWYVNDSGIYIENVKPYFRPMSSMTEEEKIKLYQKAGFYYLSNNELLKDEWRQFSDALSENELFLPYPIRGNNLQEVYDWLNENHFDYHYSYDIEDGRWKTMIEKGIAIEVTEENNPYEK